MKPTQTRVQLDETLHYYKDYDNRSRIVSLPLSLILVSTWYFVHLQAFVHSLEPNFHLAATPDAVTQGLSVYWSAFHAEWGRAEHCCVFS